ncbi:MAG: PKD domain-containing protein [Candidatus Bipolaricaulis anaerobius]
MGGKRIAAAVLVAVGAGLLTGCCLFSGAPTVSIMGPSTATVGTAVTFTATATGGSSPYTYTWSVGGSGSTVNYTFTSAGTQTIGVTVTDNCGKQASAMWPVTVSEGSGGGGNLTGMWNGTLYLQGAPYQFALQLAHQNQSVVGTAFIAGLSSPGSGSYTAGQFMFQFELPGSQDMLTLTGTYNPYANQLSGRVTVAGGIEVGSWTVMR